MARSHGRPASPVVDLDDVPEEVREAMELHLAMTIDEVLGVALEPAAVQPTAALELTTTQDRVRVGQHRPGLS
jgi:hypothetical protein